ncbi:MAG TPA: hypothetical protein VF571_09330 [Pyrinomonadaceae bacterium]|jgi:hypothetical protein
MKVTGLNAEEVVKQGLSNSNVWYVVNLTQNNVMGFAAQIGDKPEIRDAGDPYERITPVFVEKKHAETVQYLASKNAYTQDDKFGIENDTYQNIIERIKDDPEFSLQFYDSERGEQFIQQYEEFLSTREFEEKRNKELENKTLDELYEEDD